MSPAHHPTTPRADLLSVFFRHPVRWLVPTLLISAAVAIYAWNRPESWEASQALIIRNEAATRLDGPGKFLYSDQMKAIEETILEVAASRGVLERTLTEVGPPADVNLDASWPTPKDIHKLRKAFRVQAPKGTEYGKTEVIYLKVEDPDRGRALALIEAAYQELQRSFANVREARAAGMIDELNQAVTLSEVALEKVTSKLIVIERAVGSDLSELRTLDHSSTGGGQLARLLAEIHTELRQLRQANSDEQDFLELLETAQEDPHVLVAAPNDWFESQPMLLRLREGLIQAQLRTATLLGRLTEDYPKVRAARREEQAIHRDIFGELAIAMRGVQAEIAANGKREKILLQQEQEIRGRLDRLAALRAQYSNVTEQVEHRQTLLEEAQRNLAEAHASHVGARAGSLLGRIGTPEIGLEPVGPTRASIILGGVACGFLTGLGLVLLTAPSLPPDEAASRGGRIKNSANGDAREDNGVIVGPRSPRDVSHLREVPHVLPRPRDRVHVA